MTIHLNTRTAVELHGTRKSAIRAELESIIDRVDSGEKSGDIIIEGEVAGHWFI